MSFSVKSEIKENVAIVTMAGDLDSSTAPQLHEEIKKVVQENPKELVLCVEELNFMASAGMRIIIFAKQKLGSAASLILVNPQEQVHETLRMTGLLHSITIVDKYPE